MEGNHQSEKADPPEVVQREDSQSRVVSEQTNQVNDSTNGTVSSDIQVNESQEQNLKCPSLMMVKIDKGQPPNQQDQRDGSSRGIIRTRSGRILMPVHYLGT